MQFPTIRTLQQFLLLHRGVITFVAVALCLWSIGSGLHKGAPVVFTARPVHIGEVLTSRDVYIAFVEGGRGSYLESVDTVIGKAAQSDITGGVPLVEAMISQSAPTSNRVRVTLGLEQADPAQYAVGTRVHVWKLADDFAELVSTDAFVVRTIHSAVGTNAVTLSINRSDESTVVQAAAVRLVALT